MARLSLSLFGGFDVILDGQPVAGLKSDKVRALLAYLAVEAGRPHRRETLAGLLWPDSPDAAAFNSLRNALANLRQALGDAQAAPPFFLIARDAIRCNPDADFWLDVAQFEERIAPSGSEWRSPNLQSPIPNLQSLVSLYRGPFLAGFSVNSAPFEEWALYKREQFQRQALLALHSLTTHHADRGEYALAQDYARQQLVLEPYDEEAHRQLMHSLAAAGQRSAALAQYEACRRLLAAELEVKPAHETTALYEAVRDGGQRIATDKRMFTASTLPSAYPLSSVAPFVAREPELAKLDDHLKAALAGQGRVIFVTGDAGSGKTALVGEFARQAMAARGDLLAVTGNCNAQSGVGDPYLPFVEILQLLTGDIEAKRAGGAVSPEHARRLWAALPQALEALTEVGPDLVGRFVPAAALALRAGAVGRPQAPWQRRLAALIERATTGDGDSPALQPQMRLFDQVTATLTMLARQYPLILILDDLQWADAGSVGLLFHLGRRLAGSRILIVGVYRPEPLSAIVSVVHELTRLSGDNCVDLVQADGRRFVDALVDSEPNRLDVAFRDALYRRTEGHALFTVELLRGLQERGDLVRDRMSRWIECPAFPGTTGLTLDWKRLPARVEAVIAERISRLPAECQALLTAASVEGEEFTAEVLAHVLKRDEASVLGRLSGPLSKEQRLVHAQSVRRLEAGGQRLSRYRFQHTLFQTYLYRGLDAVERARLHEAVGEALAALCAGSADQLETLSPRLAWHFEAAGLPDKAIGYLLQAGRRAMRLAAGEEAIGHCTRGLALLRALPESADRDRQEMELQFGLDAAFVATRGWGARERAAVVARAFELSQRSGELTGILQTMALQADRWRAVGECARSRTLGERMLELAERTGEPVHLALAHYTLGVSLYFCGELPAGRVHLEQCVVLWGAQRDYDLMALFGADIRVMGLGWLSWALWALGYSDQALQRSQEALADAEAMAHPFTIGLALAVTCLPLAALKGDIPAVHEHLAALAKMSVGQDNAFFRVWLTTFHGWLQARQGETEAGIAAIRCAIATWEASGSRSGRPFQLALLAEAHLRGGQIAAGLTATTEGLAAVERTGARFFEAELWRLRGELQIANRKSQMPETAGHAVANRDQEAAEGETPEDCFQRAIAVARRQGAKLWELRATVSLCRLQQQPEGHAKAQQMLSDICDWFVEGFDLPDLQEARRLVA